MALHGWFESYPHGVHHPSFELGHFGNRTWSSHSSVLRAILQLDPFVIPAIQRWEAILSYPISTRWESMLRYLHDPIFVNKTKEKLYKIYTRALPAGKKLQGPNVSQGCCFCGILEDELHCFVHCIRLRPLWSWLIACFDSFGWNKHISDAERLLGYVHSHSSSASMVIWKLAHAEFIRII
jgi:hypothetical protein